VRSSSCPTTIAHAYDDGPLRPQTPGNHRHARAVAVSIADLSDWGTATA
jgi:hypothetical protein